MNSMIEVNSIFKSYSRHTTQPRYLTLRDKISGFYRNKKKEKFWALRNITFQVAQGETLGIIGGNGAGKTTLLKILSKITPPDRGEIIIRGRIASLLEVGTGFHPELTGRENIFFNGAILGLTKREIQNRFDAIVDFSGTEKFLDTPLKHYSTGMSARLAFSVASHLDPDILLIDEVLSVGDAAFQKRCLTKMNDLSQSGRTVLFVSHNLAAIRQLCRRCIYINEGELVKDDLVDETIEMYLSQNVTRQRGSVNLTHFPRRKGSQLVRMTKIELRNQTDTIKETFHIGDDLWIHLFLESFEKLRNVKIVIDLFESNGNQICNIYDSDSEFGLCDVLGKKHVSICIKDLRFYPGEYTMNVELCSEVFNHRYDIYDQLLSVISFKMMNTKVFNRALKRNFGLLYLTPQWQEHED